MKNQFVLKTSVIAVALTLAPSFVHAQQAAGETADQPAQRVYVTGSNIKRAVDTETSSPVQVIDRAEIATIGEHRQGYTGHADLEHRGAVRPWRR